MSVADEYHLHLPIGAYAPTPAQRALIETSRGLSWTGITFRRRASEWLERLRPGPVDYPAFGAEIRLWPFINGGDAYALFAPRLFDYRERRAISDHLSPGGLFVDVGTNMGLYTFSIAKARPDARILAFEPSPAVFERLRFNVAAARLADRITLKQLAVADRPGVLRFNTTVESFVMGGGDLDVPTDTLVNVLNGEGIDRVDAIKVDVEGFEDRVLVPFFKEAGRSLWPKLVIVEHLLGSLWQDDCVELMKSLDYERLWRTRFNTALRLRAG